jgi:hypothetical protein
MKLSLVSGVFEAGEEIYDIADTSETPLETTLYGIVSGYDIVDGGSGYYPGDFISISGDGIDAAAQISDVSTAKIDRLKINTVGHGYRLGTLATVDNTDTGGSGLIVNVTGITNTYPVTIGANTYTLGEITQVSVANTGTGYYAAPTISLTDSEVYSAGLLTDKYITIADAGNTYFVGDWLTFNAPVGSGANAEVASVDLGLQPRTNYIRNSTMVGANTASNTLPTNWFVLTYGTGGTLNPTIVGSGTEDGISYVDVRINGTSGTGSRVHWYFDSVGNANAVHGETWAGSVYTKLVSGSFANTTSFGLRLDEATSAEVYVAGGDNSSAVFPTTAPLSSQRFSFIRTLSGGYTVAKVFFSNIIYFTNSSAVDFTIRIGLPQLEKNYFVTDPIPTTNTAVTVSGTGELTRINYVRNSKAFGAVAGTPGTPPTNWVINAGSTLSSQIVGSGVEDGIDYIDVRIFGTNTSGSIQYSNIRFESITNIAAVANSVWTNSAYLRRVAGSTANVSGQIMILSGYTSGGVSTNQYATNTISSFESSTIRTNRQLVTSSNTAFSNTSTAFVAPWFQFQVNNGNAIDITVRIGGPQTEFGNTATSLIPTYGVAARRPSNEPTNDYSIYLEDGDRLLDETQDFFKYDTTNTSIAVWNGLGRISRIRMTNYGLNYSANSLPVITMNTLYGSSANLIVTNLQGGGANVQVDVANNTQSIGGIRRIEPVNFGINYTYATASTVGVGDENANIVPVITGSAITTGEYTNDDGKVNYKKIQDSYYYQDYSYVIRSGIEIAKYKNVLKKLLHPSGLEVFGEIQILNTLDLHSSMMTNFIRQIILSSAESLEPTKVVDFIPSEAYSVYSQVPISVLQNSAILQYQYYTFLSPYGEAVYYEIEKNLKLAGNVSVFTSNSAVIGNGTAFTSNFSSGDEFVVIDRSASKNILTFPDDMSNAIWAKSNISTTNTVYNDIQGPFDTWTADRMVESTANSTHGISQTSVSVVPNSFYTVSTYIKSYSANRTLRIQWQNTGSTAGIRAYYNPDTGVVSGGGTFGSAGAVYVGATMTNVGNGWYRCTLSGKADNVSSTLRLTNFIQQNTSISSYAGDNVSGLYFDAFQIEAGNTATSYAGPFFNPNHKFTVNTITSDTLMTVRVPPSANVINSDHYVIAI